MLTISRKEVNINYVELDISYEMFNFKSGIETKRFDTKEQANRYYESMLKSVILFNLEAFINSIGDKSVAGYKVLHNELKWCIDMDVDYKTIIDVVKNNRPTIDLLVNDSPDLKFKEYGNKLIQFCS